MSLHLLLVDAQIQIYIAIFPLIALFSLYVAQFLNRLDNIFHKISKEKTKEKRKILDAWFVVCIAHWTFTAGIILTSISVCLGWYKLATNLGVSVFCAGYTALIVGSAQMFVSKYRTLQKLSVPTS